MSNDLIETGAVNILASIAARAGVNVGDAEQLLALARQWVTAGVSLLDGHAKKAAEAAGDAAAAEIKTEDQAEAAMRKP